MSNAADQAFDKAARMFESMPSNEHLAPSYAAQLVRQLINDKRSSLPICVEGEGYTEGPWNVCPEPRGGGFAISSDAQGVVALSIQRDKHPLNGKHISHEQAHANARLIACAPELLEALAALYEVASVECDEDYAAVTNAAAVIAKATGA